MVPLPDTAVNAESRIQLERRILAALCIGTCEGSVRDFVRARLSDYTWTDAAHQAIFEIMTSFPSPNTAALREQLPALLTRRGFPDFDFIGLFSGPIAAQEEVENWLGHLVGINS